MDTMVMSPRSETEGMQWPAVGEFGLVPLEAVVPDPDQPRKFFDDEELDALASTLKEGGQRDIIVVRELTASERASGSYPAPARYMIVSGERRWRASKRAGLTAVEIRVRHYDSKAAQMLDAYLINENRIGLSDIEKAVFIDALARESGWRTHTDISRHTGEHQSRISELMALLKLSLAVQRWMMPDVPEENRLKMQTAVFLARNVENHEMQEDLVTRMPKGRTNSNQQRLWLREEFKKAGIQVEFRKHKPSDLRQLVHFFADQVSNRIAVLEGSNDLGTLFANATQKQTEQLVREVTGTLSKLQQFLRKVQELSNEHLLQIAEDERTRATKKAPAPEPPRQPDPPSPPPMPKAPPPERKPARSPKKVTRQPSFIPTRHDPDPKDNSQKASPAAREPKHKDITVSFFDERIGRTVMDKISPAKYVQLWDMGQLKFQKEGAEKPDYLPTRDEAEQDT